MNDYEKATKESLIRMVKLRDREIRSLHVRLNEPNSMLANNVIRRRNLDKRNIIIGVGLLCGFVIGLVFTLMG